jgi:hypothetical protein
MLLIICFIAISAIICWGPFFIISCTLPRPCARMTPPPSHTHQGTPPAGR